MPRAVVRHFDDVAGLDGDFDVGAVPGQRFVDGVVHDLVDQVMQAGRAGGTDIHARALAHRLQALQDLNLGAAVGVVGGRLAVGFGDDFFCHEVIASCLDEGFGIYYKNKKITGLRCPEGCGNVPF